MVSINTVVKKLGKYVVKSPYCYASTLREVAPDFGLKDIAAELLILRGAKFVQVIPVVHIEATGQLLTWCEHLSRIVDLSKVRNVKKGILKCHSTMLDYLRDYHYRNVATSWADEIQIFATGEWDSEWSTVLAEMTGRIHTAGQIEQTIFSELIATHTGAILEEE